MGNGRRRSQPVRQILCAAVIGALALLAGCTVHEGRTESGEKKVDIQTPFANLKVNTDVDPKDTGLPVYPGAHPAPSSEHDKHAANVNISSGEFGLKVVAIKFQTDDAPEKVIGFYRDKLKAFGGKFLECEDQKGFGNYTSGDDHELTCSKRGGGDSVELKAGTPDRQHIVSVKRHGSGSEFALVYVQKHGREGAL